MVSEVSSWLLTLLPGVLLLMAYLGGFAATLANRRRLGRATLPAAVGTGILVIGGLVSLGSLAFSYNLPQIVRDSGTSISEAALILGVLSLISGLLHLVGIVLTMLAIFVGRAPAAPPFTPAPYASPA